MGLTLGCRPTAGEPGRGCRAWEGTADLQEPVRAGHMGRQPDAGSENAGGTGVRDSAKARGSVQAQLGCEVGLQGRAWVFSGAPG